MFEELSNDSFIFDELFALGAESLPNVSILYIVCSLATLARLPASKGVSSMSSKDATDEISLRSDSDIRLSPDSAGV